MLQRILAVVYDFDVTLSPTYMMEPLEKHFNYDLRKFWKAKDDIIEQQKNQGLKISEDVIYLHLFIKYAQKGMPFHGLTRDVFRECGKDIRLYPGLPGFLPRMTERIEEDPKYADIGIKVEHYVISTGLAEMLRGNRIMKHLAGFDACEFIYDEGGVPIGVSRPLGHTQKTETLYFINKGIFHSPHIDINDKIPDERRRVPFRNMIYVGDGPTDVPCMSLVRHFGGQTFAVFNPHPEKEVMLQSFVDDAAKHGYRLRMDGRADFAVRADYRKGSDMDILMTKALRTMADNVLVEAEHFVNDGLQGKMDFYTS